MNCHLDDSGSDVPAWHARLDADHPARRAWTAAGIVLLAGWIGAAGLVSGIWIERTWPQVDADMIGDTE